MTNSARPRALRDCAKNTVKPHFLYHTTDDLEIIRSFKQDENIHLVDEIYSQLAELIELRNPVRDLEDWEIKAKVEEHLNGQDIAEYGIWVYYPWLRTMVHLLDEKEFAEVRTNRNKYKITEEEQETLSKKKIGVVGLSVGQSVSLTMAMERGFGELRIADFDELELTNLNRIRTGVHTLGLPKTTIVAREIAEIDPFLNVVVFDEGITEDNIDRFMGMNGEAEPLDLIIDECDGLDIKILLREKAKQMNIPVVMDMSDRGTLDVERFDEEKDYPLLHGLIGDVDYSEVKNLGTYEDKIPYLLPMIDTRTLSKRLKASMLEVGTSIRTWPQLASAVTLGGALGADVTRRILLNADQGSGRFRIDLEELTSRGKEVDLSAVVNPSIMRRTNKEDELQISLADLKVEASDARVVLDEKEALIYFEELRKAPSSGNTQPWKAHYENGVFFFFATCDLNSLTNKDNHLGKVNLGVLMAHFEILIAKNYSLLEEHIIETEKGFLAWVSLKRGDENEHKWKAAFENLLDLRSTQRDERKEAISQERFEAFQQDVNDLMSKFPGVKTQYKNKPEEISSICTSIERADMARFLNQEMHEELFMHELAYSKDDKRGIAVNDLMLDLKNQVGLELVSDPEVIKLLNNWEKGGALGKLTREKVMDSDFMCLISVDQNLPQALFYGGKVLMYIWLLCAKHNIAVHPFTSPVFLGPLALDQNFKSAYPYLHELVQESRNILHEVYELGENDRPVFLTRLFQSSLPQGSTSQRIPLKEFMYGES